MTEINATLVFNLFSTVLTGVLFLLSQKLKGKKGGLTFQVFTLTLTLWSFGKFFKNYFLHSNPEWVEFYTKLSFIGSSGITPWFYLLTLQLSPRHHKKSLLAALAIPYHLTLILLDQFDLMHTASRLSDWGPIPQPGPFYALFLIGFFLYLIMGVKQLYPRQYSKRWSGHTQSLFLFWGVCITILLGTPEIVSVVFAPVFPIADLAPASFATVLYVGIFRYDYLGGQSLIIQLGMRALYYLFLTMMITTGIFVYDKFFLNSPASGWILTSMGAMVILFLTPLLTKLIQGTQEKIFPVRAQFNSASKQLAAQLKRAKEPRECITLLENILINDLSYPKIRFLSTSQSEFQREAFGQRKVLSRVRFNQSTEDEKKYFWKQYKFLKKQKADLAIPIASENQFYGYILAQESQWLLEHWNTVYPLLDELATKVGDQIFLIDILRENHQKEQIAEMGLMTAQLAHEIKNPLEGIYGASQFLLEEDPENEFYQIISEDSQRLNHIVHNFLEFARPHSFHLEKLNVSQWLKEYSNQLHQRGIAHELRLNEIQSSVMADRASLEQVTLNLIQNAHKHGASPKRPILFLQKEENLVKWGVKDFGQGVLVENQPRLFKPFFSTHPEGNGLGLALSKKILQAHKGRLYFTPDEVGSTFTCELPKCY